MSSQVYCLDDLLKLGRYTLFLGILFEIILLHQTGNLIFMVFAGSIPHITSCISKNGTVYSGDDQKYFCELFENETCIPQLQSQFHSVNAEWNYICGRGNEVKDSTSYQAIGFLFGALIMGQISDTFGRKWPLLLCVFFTSLTGFLSALSNNLLLFTLTRTANSIFNAGHTVVLMVFMCETIPKTHRMWLNFVLSWAPNYILASGIAYLTKGWKEFSIVLSLLGILACIILFFTQESCFWLLRKKRTEDAERVLKKIYKFDRYEINEIVLRKTIEAAQPVENYKDSTDDILTESFFFQHLFCTWKLTSFTVVLCLGYFSSTLVNYGIMFNLEDIAGSIYLNILIVGIIRTTLSVLAGVIDFKCTRIGRKISHNLFCGYTVAALFAVSIWFSIASPSTPSPILRYLILSAGAVVYQLYSILVVTTSELFPTHIRNMAYASMEIIGSLASVIAPQMFVILPSIRSLPYWVMLISMLLEIIFYILFIPETKGKPLADGMPPIEERLWGNKRIREKEEVERNTP